MSCSARTTRPDPRPSDIDGRNLSGVSGVIDQMLFLLREEGATHVGCATDHVIESFRNDLFPGYKSSFGMPPELLDQFPIVEDALRALGLVVWPMVEFEADDAIAAACLRFKDAPGVDQVLVCTPDKDMAQLVDGERVVLLDRRRRITYDEAGVNVKWGVPPSAIPDWLALVGDSSDGYPGLPGWGAKSAAAVLARYGSIEAIPVKASAWDVKSLRGGARPRRHAPRALGRGAAVSLAGPPPDHRRRGRHPAARGGRASLARRAANRLGGVLRSVGPRRATFPPARLGRLDLTPVSR